MTPELLSAAGGTHKSVREGEIGQSGKYRIGDLVKTRLPSAPKGSIQFSDPKKILRQIAPYSWALDDVWSERKMAPFREYT